MAVSLPYTKQVRLLSFVTVTERKKKFLVHCKIKLIGFMECHDMNIVSKMEQVYCYIGI